MMKLQSFKNSMSQYGILRNDMSFELIRKDLSIYELNEMEGFFYLIDQSIYAFKSNEIRNRFCYNNTWVELPENAKLSYQRLNKYECQFEWLNKNDKRIFSIVYYQPDYGLIERIGYNEGEEDYNFGLWLYRRSHNFPVN